MKRTLEYKVQRQQPLAVRGVYPLELYAKVLSQISVRWPDLRMGAHRSYWSKWTLNPMAAGPTGRAEETSRYTGERAMKSEAQINLDMPERPGVTGSRERDDSRSLQACSRRQPGESFDFVPI